MGKDIRLNVHLLVLVLSLKLDMVKKIDKRNPQPIIEARDVNHRAYESRLYYLERIKKMKKNIIYFILFFVLFIYNSCDTSMHLARVNDKMNTFTKNDSTYLSWKEVYLCYLRELYLTDSSKVPLGYVIIKDSLFNEYTFKILKEDRVFTTWFKTRKEAVKMCQRYAINTERDSILRKKNELRMKNKSLIIDVIW